MPMALASGEQRSVRRQRARFPFTLFLPRPLDLVAKLSLASGAHAAVVANHWAEGGKGAVDLGAAVAEACAAAKAVSVCED